MEISSEKSKKGVRFDEWASPQNFMIDRLVLSIYNLHIAPLSRREFDSLGDSLTQQMFRMTKGDNCYIKKYRFRKNSGYRGRATFGYSPDKSIATLITTLDINPTRQMNRIYSLKSGQKFPKSFDNKDNYLPFDVIEKIGLEKLHFENIQESINIVDRYLSSIWSEFSRHLDCAKVSISNPAISIQEIEIYWDVPNPNPFYYLEELTKYFQSYFKNVEQSHYNKNSCSKSYNHNVVCLKGSNHKYEFHKIYAKTNSTLRFESNYKKERLQNLINTNVLEQFSHKSFC